MIFSTEVFSDLTPKMGTVKRRESFQHIIIDSSRVISKNVSTTFSERLLINIGPKTNLLDYVIQRDF